MTIATAEHGVITEAGAIRFERLLPGPIERVWDYLVDPAKRRISHRARAVEALLPAIRELVIGDAAQANPAKRS